MKKKIIFLILLLNFTNIFCIDEISSKDTLNFEVQWFPQAQFAGYIMAYEKGFYHKEGLDVNLIFSDGSSSPLDNLLDGKTDFCTAWLSQAITSKANGGEIVNICQVLHKSSLMLISKKNRNIQSPQDMNGKKISLWSGDFSIQLNAFFQKYDISFEKIPQSYNIYTFLSDAVDVTSAMYYNEYHKIIQAGINEDELTTFFFSDHDLNFPEDGIYCLSDSYQSDRNICEKLTFATLRGWEYTFQNQDESLKKVIQYCEKYHLQTNYSHQKWMLKVIETSLKYRSGKNRSKWGKLHKEDYQMVGEILREQSVINEIPLYEDFYKRVKVTNE